MLINSGMTERESRRRDTGAPHEQAYVRDADLFRDHAGTGLP